MSVSRIEGWGCGVPRHLHLSEVEAESCVERSGKRKRIAELHEKLRAQGWVSGCAGDGSTLLVHAKTGRGALCSKANEEKMLQALLLVPK